MFNKIAVPSLGIVENMSFYQCRQCGHKDFVFGHNGAVRTAEELGIEVLGQVRLKSLAPPQLFEVPMRLFCKGRCACLFIMNFADEAG